MQIVDTANQKQTQDLKREIDEIKDAVVEENRKRVELEKKFEELQEKNRKLEKALIKNNVIIFGFQTVEGEDILEKVIKFPNGHLDTPLTSHDINDIYTIGKTEEKPIIIKFVTYLKKTEIIKKAYKLKDYNKTNNSKVYITHELTSEEQQELKILRQHRKQAINKGYSAYIKKGQLMVGDESYTAQQLRSLEESNSTAEGVESEKETEKEKEKEKKKEKELQYKGNTEKEKSKTNREEESEEDLLNRAKKFKTTENKPCLPSGGRTRKKTT